MDESLQRELLFGSEPGRRKTSNNNNHNDHDDSAADVVNSLGLLGASAFNLNDIIGEQTSGGKDEEAAGGVYKPRDDALDFGDEDELADEDDFIPATSTSTATVVDDSRRKEAATAVVIKTKSSSKHHHRSSGKHSVSTTSVASRDAEDQGGKGGVEESVIEVPKLRENTPLCFSQLYIPVSPEAAFLQRSACTGAKELPGSRLAQAVLQALLSNTAAAQSEREDGGGGRRVVEGTLRRWLRTRTGIRKQILRRLKLGKATASGAKGSVKGPITVVLPATTPAPTLHLDRIAAAEPSTPTNTGSNVVPVNTVKQALPSGWTSGNPNTRKRLQSRLWELEREFAARRKQSLIEVDGDEGVEGVKEENNITIRMDWKAFHPVNVVPWEDQVIIDSPSTSTTQSITSSVATRARNGELDSGAWVDAIVWDDTVLPARPTAVVRAPVLPMADPALVFEPLTTSTASGALNPQVGGMELNKQLHLAESAINAQLRNLQQSTGTGAGAGAGAAGPLKPGLDRYNVSFDAEHETAVSRAAAKWALAAATAASSASRLQRDATQAAAGGAAAGPGGEQRNTPRTAASLAPLPLKHSIPALKLLQPHFKTTRSRKELRSFHRPQLTITQAIRGFEPLKLSSTNNNSHQDKRRKKEQQQQGEITNSKGISLRDGSPFFLVEYSEESPPVLSNPGMASYALLYYRKTGQQDPNRPAGLPLLPLPQPPPGSAAAAAPPNAHLLSTTALFARRNAVLQAANATLSPFPLEPGEPSPFWSFCDMNAPGSMLAALVNNLYRAPMWPHALGSTDFLLLRFHQPPTGTATEGEVLNYLRPLGKHCLWLAGQTMPVAPVFAPHSKRLKDFCRDRILVASYRQFAKDDSASNNAAATGQRKSRLKIKKLTQAFPQFSEASIRKWLKEFAESIRGGTGTGGARGGSTAAGSWELRKDAPVLSEDDLRALVPPEAMCLYDAMLWGQQRLVDSGYAFGDVFAEAHRRAQQDSVDDPLESVSESEMDDSSTGHAASIISNNNAAVPEESVDERALAPWILTSNFISAVSSAAAAPMPHPSSSTSSSSALLGPLLSASSIKSSPSAMLRITGLGDPTGAVGEGFSFLKAPPIPPLTVASSTGGIPDLSAVHQRSAAITNIWKRQASSLASTCGPAIPATSNAVSPSSAAEQPSSQSQLPALSQPAVAVPPRRLVITVMKKSEEGFGSEDVVEQLVITDPRIINGYLRQKRVAETQKKRRETALKAANVARERKLATSAAAQAMRNLTTGGASAPPAEKKKKPPVVAAAAPQEGTDSTAEGSKKKPSAANIKCGACGALGHMRTNRVCPLFQPSSSAASSPTESAPPAHFKLTIPSSAQSSHESVSNAAAAPSSFILKFKPQPPPQ